MIGYMSEMAMKPETVLRLLNDGDDKRWYTAMMLCENGNLQGAAKLVNNLLNEPGPGEQVRELLRKYHHIDQIMADQLMYDMIENGDLYQDKVLGIVYKNVILYVSHEAALQDDIRGDVLPMMKSAVALGVTELAFNIANAIMSSAMSVSEYREAEEYYGIALKFSKSDSDTAAALVNSAHIICDGLVTGTPDIPAAIERFMKAGDLGQLTGMYNVAYYSIALAHVQNDPKHYAVAEQWLERFIVRMDAAEGLMVSDVRADTNNMIDSALEALAKLHITQRATSPDPDYALSLIRSMRKTCRDLPMLLDSIYSMKLRLLGMIEDNSDAAIWGKVMRTMGFAVNSAVQVKKELAIIMINKCDGTNDPIVLMVVDDAVFGEEMGDVTDNCKRFLSSYVKEKDHELIITSSVAFAHDDNGRIYTPVVTQAKDGTGHRLISLYPGMTTKELIDSINSNAPFIDGKSCSVGYDIAIVINEMKAGIRQSNYEGTVVEFGEMGEWQIPHARYWLN